MIVVLVDLTVIDNKSSRATTIKVHGLAGTKIAKQASPFLEEKSWETGLVPLTNGEDPFLSITAETKAATRCPDRGYVTVKALGIFAEAFTGKIDGLAV